MSCKEVCAFCRHWKAGMQSNRDTLLDTLAYRECHVKQPNETRADETCSMWTEVGSSPAVSYKVISKHFRKNQWEIDCEGYHDRDRAVGIAESVIERAEVERVHLIREVHYIEKKYVKTCSVEEIEGDEE